MTERDDGVKEDSSLLVTLILSNKDISNNERAFLGKLDQKQGMIQFSEMACDEVSEENRRTKEETRIREDKTRIMQEYRTVIPTQCPKTTDAKVTT